MNPPTEARPLELVCTVCDGDGGYEANCRGCRGTGRMAITQCPLALITPDVDLAIAAERHARRGRLPREGGWLEQTAIGLEAITCVERERARSKMNSEEQS